MPIAFAGCGMDFDKPTEHTCMVKEQSWYHYITVEPIMFLYMMAFMITTVIEQTFYVFQTCRVNHGYSEEICYNISNEKNVSIEVQMTTAIFHQWNGIAAHVVPLLLAFFLGSYSDKRGRKVVLLSGLFGKLFFSIMIVVNTMNEWPVEYIIYTATIPCALTGGDLAIFAAVFAYIADVSSLKSRTLRVGILDIVYLSTMPTGVALGSYLYNKVFNKSFTLMFTVNVCLMSIATLYCIFFTKWQTRPEQKSLREAGVRNPITDFFDWNNIVQTIVTLTKKRHNRRRLFLWFILISMAFYTFQRDEKPVLYLYTMNVFGWDATDFSNYRVYASVAFVVVTLLGIPLMTKVFNWRDAIILMIGASSHMAGHFIYSQATVGSTMYIGATVAALGSCVAPLIRSMASKVLAPAERGVVYAFLSVMENIVAMFASILYTQLYNASLKTDYVNAIFYLTIGTQAVVFTLSLTMDVMLRGKRLEAHCDEDLK